MLSENEKMVNKTTLSLIFLVLVLSPLVSAAFTEINVKTWADHRVNVMFYSPNDPQTSLDSKSAHAPIDGKVVFNYTGDLSVIDIRVQVTKPSNNGEELVLVNRFEDMKTGSPLYLQVIPGNVSDNYKQWEKEEVKVENTTTPANQQPAENDTVASGSSWISGAVSGVGNVFTSKITYFIIGGIVLVLVVGLILFNLFKQGSPQLVSSHILSRPTEPKVDVNGLNRQLTEAQRKLKDAQIEINKLKNRERIEGMEKRIQQEKEELERLRKGL